MWTCLCLTALLNNCLIPLDKNPGVRPVGISEMLRRIIGKSVMTDDGAQAGHAGVTESVHAGHLAGCEAVIGMDRLIVQ